MKKKYGEYFLSITILLILASECGEKEKTKSDAEKIVAQVGTEVLTLETIKETIPAEFETTVTLEQLKGYIQQWIDTQVAYQEAKRRGLYLSYSNELKKELKRVEAEFLANKLLESELEKAEEVTEEEIETYYEENREAFVRPSDEVKALYILVATREECDNILLQLREGATFEEIVKQRSPEVAEKIDRGNIGYISRDDMIPEIARVVFNMSLNRVSQPIKTDFGYFLFKLLDKKDKDSVRTLEEVREQIRETIKARKRKTRYNEIITQLTNQTLIKTNFDLLREMVVDSTSLTEK